MGRMGRWDGRESSSAVSRVRVLVSLFSLCLVVFCDVIDRMNSDGEDT